MEQRVALVTGATGYIGGRLVTALLEKGWKVRASGRAARPATLAADATYVAADLAGDDDLAPLFKDVSHLFHLAGASSSLASEAEMIRSNVTATERLLDEACECDTLERILYMSSTSVYGEDVKLPSPVTEEFKPQPSRAYGKAKWATEELLWQADQDGAPIIVVRPVSVYGPGNIKLLASAILDAAIERFAGEKVLAVGATEIEQRLVHIDDVVRACMHLAVHPWSVGGCFNIVFPSYPTNHQVAEMIAGPLGMEVEITDDAAGGFEYDRRAEMRDEMLAEGMRPDILLTAERFRFMGKANPNNRLSIDSLLSTGFQFDGPDLATGIAATIDWYRDQRWIL